MKYLREIKNLENVRVLLRLDLNLPVINGKITDDFRMRRILPTILYIKEKKAKIILMSHIEGAETCPSLEPVADHFEKYGVKVVFVSNYKKAIGEIEKLPPGGIILLENLRQNEGEMKNDKGFAKELASLGDIYVNEAFAVSHRKHASIDAITNFLPSYAGMLFEQEVENLSKAFNPEHPFIFILGGAKFETKLPLLEKFLNIADKVFVGGALANDFFKEKGKDVGKSVISEKNFNLSRFSDNPKLLLPIDEVWKNNAILDAGPKTVEMLREEIGRAKFILWNGPLGLYEEGFVNPTHELAAMIVKATEGGAKSILGGGDTLAVIANQKIEDKFTFVSTGGGAMLDFLANGTLEGIEALEKSND